MNKKDVRRTARVVVSALAILVAAGLLGLTGYAVSVNVPSQHCNDREDDEHLQQRESGPPAPVLGSIHNIAPSPGRTPPQASQDLMTDQCEGGKGHG
jgi:hypothetical protein